MTLARELSGGGRVISVICSPGDRSDECICALGRAAASLSDSVIVKEDLDLRGRKPGETAGLLVLGLKEGGFPEHLIAVESDEEAAFRSAIMMAVPGDIVVVYYEEYGLVIETIGKVLGAGKAPGAFEMPKTHRVLGAPGITEEARALGTPKAPGTQRVSGVCDENGTLSPFSGPPQHTGTGNSGTEESGKTIGADAGDQSYGQRLRIRASGDDLAICRKRSEDGKGCFDASD